MESILVPAWGKYVRYTVWALCTRVRAAGPIETALRHDLVDADADARRRRCRRHWKVTTSHGLRGYIYRER